MKRKPLSEFKQTPSGKRCRWCGHVVDAAYKVHDFEHCCQDIDGYACTRPRGHRGQCIPCGTRFGNHPRS